ncbi:MULTISPECIES: hypothetical protein [Nostoc]|uniref:hypothetical protein n=1 Tax=Nostoc TaxID=1177 RepID=UPI0016879619|nr:MULTISPECIES: hypothetical protein [Nostoc]
MEFRLGYLGRYWSLISVAGLFIGFLLCALIFLPLIINVKAGNVQAEIEKLSSTTIKTI